MKMTLTCRHVVCRPLHCSSSSPLYTYKHTQRERHIRALTLFKFDLLIERKKTKIYQNKNKMSWIYLGLQKFSGIWKWNEIKWNEMKWNETNWIEAARKRMQINILTSNFATVTSKNTRRSKLALKYNRLNLFWDKFKSVRNKVI